MVALYSQPPRQRNHWQPDDLTFSPNPSLLFSQIEKKLPRYPELPLQSMCIQSAVSLATAACSTNTSTRTWWPQRSSTSILPIRKVSSVARGMLLTTPIGGCCLQTAPRHRSRLVCVRSERKGGSSFFRRIQSQTQPQAAVRVGCRVKTSTWLSILLSHHSLHAESERKEASLTSFGSILDANFLLLFRFCFQRGAST